MSIIDWLADIVCMWERVNTANAWKSLFFTWESPCDGPLIWLTYSCQFFCHLVGSHTMSKSYNKGARTNLYLRDDHPGSSPPPAATCCSSTIAPANRQAEESRSPRLQYKAQNRVRWQSSCQGLGLIQIFLLFNRHKYCMSSAWWKESICWSCRLAEPGGKVGCMSQLPVNSPKLIACLGPAVNSHIDLPRDQRLIDLVD